MNEIQVLQEELNRLKIKFDNHWKESDHSILKLEALVACLLAANIRSGSMTQTECSNLLNQLKEIEDSKTDDELDFIYNLMLTALRV